ncbi:hypothetical protein D0869_13271 [Hortaea werneckii]|uniref:Multicopper oxidase n=2 Tax=Hortaea werneckii TaxID=91943 RepID=A0A3M7AHL4_HORWE|nr:hypothetical protein D0869_13271 [Hortaea werneckii]RMX95204.1 hypothetical protein D0868_11862 [Hortaea werneckii]RMY26918.1 hypothetical protein D0866_10514 [Hortaea werneckii]
MLGSAQAASAALASRDIFGFVNGAVNNTLSILGTPQQRHFPDFLNGPKPHGFPWGDHHANDTNYYDWTPNTGMTRRYEWSVAKEKCSPDGVEIDCLLVNGEFPGPTIEANWGDIIEVKVTNDMVEEGTSIHWHGILQKNSVWMDGVPGYGQCPIAPGASFTYRFQADLYGTSWWHSHYSSQYASGLAGPVVIHGPKNADYDVDLGPIFVNDWYHEYYTEVTEALFAPLPEVNIPRSDNNLINGKNSFDCSKTSLPCKPDAPLASFNFTSGKSYRMRFINPSAAATEKITIDGHKFTVIANDFVPIQPYETDVLTLAVGQRSDVIVEATGEPTDSVWLRAYKPQVCWPSNGGDEVKAAIFYQDADHSQPPTSTAGPNAYSNNCNNDPLEKTQPYYPIKAGEASSTEVIPLEFKPNNTGPSINGSHLLWYMANRTFIVNYNDPMLLETKLGNLDFPYLRNAHNYGSNSSLRFVVENTGPQPHPMHVHGHNMFILAEGDCVSNMTVFGNEEGISQEGNMTEYPKKRGLNVRSVEEIEKRADGQYGSCWDGHITNPDNPQRRDVQMLAAGRYIVVQWNQDNPGVWPFHCHIAWHLSAGFVWTVVERPDDVQKYAQIPSIMAQTCRDWSAWTGENVVPQIDDGL